jgi:hypothetical protein
VEINIHGTVVGNCMLRIVFLSFEKKYYFGNPDWYGKVRRG